MTQVPRSECVVYILDPRPLEPREIAHHFFGVSDPF